jgi:hypothetical protein
VRAINITFASNCKACTHKKATFFELVENKIELYSLDILGMKEKQSIFITRQLNKSSRTSDRSCTM